MLNIDLTRIWNDFITTILLEQWFLIIHSKNLNESITTIQTGAGHQDQMNFTCCFNFEGQLLQGRGVWWALLHGGYKESDMIYWLNNSDKAGKPSDLFYKSNISSKSESD